MSQRLHPQAYDALRDALTHFYWYKQNLAGFLHGEFAGEPSVLAGLEPLTATKRETATAITDRLRQDEDRYRDVTLRVLVTLAGFDEQFPHLARLDDGASKVADAKAALDVIRAVTKQYRQQLNEMEARAADLRAAGAQDLRRRAFAGDLDELRTAFLALSGFGSAQERGLALEPLLNELFKLFDLDPRAAFKIAHEQIDGAFTFDTDDYLLEARWRKEQSDPDQVRAFEAKVSAKAHRTGGVLLSMSGFTSGAIEVLRGKGTRLLLMDGGDLMTVLDGRIDLPELLLRKRRYAAETGHPFLSAIAMLTNP